VNGHYQWPVGGAPWRIRAPAPAVPHRGRVPYLTKPPRSTLPGLVALPSWRIVVKHARKQDRDFLDFAATVWIGGNGPLDAEGFRSHASPVMKAYRPWVR
jgi:hypothetical protein